MFHFDQIREKLTLRGAPRADRILVLPLVAATASKIVVTDSNRELPERGLVLAVGPGGVSPETGRPIAVQAQIGQIVSFGRYAGLRMDIAGPGYAVPAFIMRDSEVLYVQENIETELLMHDDDPRKVHEAGLTCEWCPKPDGAEAEQKADETQAKAELEEERAQVRSFLERERAELRLEREAAFGGK